MLYFARTSKEICLCRFLSLSRPPDLVYYPMSAVVIMALRIAIPLLVTSPFARVARGASVSMPSAKMLQQQLNHSIAHKLQLFRFVKGVYDFGATSFINEGAQQMLMEADSDSIFWFEPWAGVVVIDCHNITIRGLVLDNRPAPLSQGTVQAVHFREKSVDVVVYDGFPMHDPDLSSCIAGDPETKVIYWNRDTTLMEPGQSFPGYKGCTKLGHWQYRLRLKELTYVPKVGAAVTISPRVRNDSHAALPTYYAGMYSIYNSSDVLTQGVAVYGGGTFAILEWGGEGGHVYDNVVVGRHPAPPYPFRLLSTNLDGFHSFSVHRGPLVHHSTLAFMGDDFVTLHNRIWLVLETVRAHGLLLVDVGDVWAAGGTTFLSGVPSVAYGDTLALFALDSHAPQGMAQVAAPPRAVRGNGTFERARHLLTLIDGPPAQSRCVGGGGTGPGSMASKPWCTAQGLCEAPAGNTGAAFGA